MPRLPVELGAVEHLVGTFAVAVARQDDGQEALTAGLVVEGLLGLDLQDGMQAELIEGRVSSRVGWRRRPIRSCRADDRLSCVARPLLLSEAGRRRSVQGAFGMDMADEVDVAGQVRQHALAAVGAVAGDEDVVVGKPGGDQGNQLDGQLGSGAMVGIGAWPWSGALVLFFLPLVRPWRLR